jgi:probable phosphoglycerate mutase
MTKFLFIRHADNPSLGNFLASRMPDVHLNENGRLQANLLAGTLKDLPLTAIYSSPLDRARETAQPLADALNLPIHIHDGLHEIDYGELQGKPIQEIRKSEIWKRIKQDPTSVQLPGGETYLAAQNRFAAAVDEIHQAYPQDDQIVACFTHADTIRLGVAHFSGAPITSFTRYTIDTASVTFMDLRDGMTNLGFINLQVPLARNLILLSKISK